MHCVCTVPSLWFHIASVDLLCDLSEETRVQCCLRPDNSFSRAHNRWGLNRSPEPAITSEQNVLALFIFS